MAGDLREGVLEPETLDALLIENYALVTAAHEQQNIGRFEDALEYQRRLGANLQAVADAICAAGARVVVREPAGSDDGDGDGQARLAAADARALTAAAASMAAGLPALGVGPAPSADEGGGHATATTSGAAAAAAPAITTTTASGGGAAGRVPTVAEQTHTQQQQQQQQPHRQQQQQQPAAAQPPPWLPDVDRPADALLAALGLREHAAVLAANGIDMAALRLLTREDLRGLGLPLGACVKIEAALRSGGGGSGGGGVGGGGNG